MDANDVLFSKTQQRVLRVLFADKGARNGLSYAEILRRTGGGSGAIHRELGQFLAAGLVVERDGPRQRVFVPNPEHPVYSELRALTGKLFGGNKDLKPPQRRLDPVLARALARKYLWWASPGEALGDRDRLVAQVMHLGTLEDMQTVEQELGEDRLRRVLTQASAGQFDARSWTYWHYRLGLAQPGRVPSLPERRLA